jgi:Nse1 non-SMC component of SMC5-6 complex
MGMPKQHQMFVQCLMVQGALPVGDARELYNSCGQTVVQACDVTRAREVASDEDGLITVADQINKDLQRVGMQLKTVYSPFDKVSYWGLVNTADDPPSRLATELSANQLRYFFCIVNDLLDNVDLSLVEVQNMGPEFKLTVTGAGQTVQSLHRNQWLKILKRSTGPSKIVFGPKSLLELPNVRAWALNGGAAGEKGVNDDGEGQDNGENDENSDSGDCEDNANNNDVDDDALEIADSVTPAERTKGRTRSVEALSSDGDSSSDTPPMPKRRRRSGRSER